MPSREAAVADGKSCRACHVHERWAGWPWLVGTTPGRGMAYITPLPAEVLELLEFEETEI